MKSEFIEVDEKYAIERFYDDWFENLYVPVEKKIKKGLFFKKEEYEFMKNGSLIGYFTFNNYNECLNFLKNNNNI